MVEHKTVELLEEVLKKPISDKEMYAQKKSAFDKAISEMSEEELNSLLLHLKEIEGNYIQGKRYNRVYQNFLKNYKIDREIKFPDLPFEFFPNTVIFYLGNYRKNRKTRSNSQEAKIQKFR